MRCTCRELQGAGEVLRAAAAQGAATGMLCLLVVTNNSHEDSADECWLDAEHVCMISPGMLCCVYVLDQAGCAAGAAPARQPQGGAGAAGQRARLCRSSQSQW